MVALPASLWQRGTGCCSRLGTSSSTTALHKLSHRSQHSAAEQRKLDKDMQRELILSVLESHPSSRDSRAYLQNFSPRQSPAAGRSSSAAAKAVAGKLPLDDPLAAHNTPAFPLSDTATPTTAFVDPSRATDTVNVEGAPGKTELAEELMQPVNRHTALVKIQGPFTERQLGSIAEGMVYLKKLGLVSIIVLDNENWDVQRQLARDATGEDKEKMIAALREEMKRDTLKFADMLETRGGEARPLLEGVLCVAGATFAHTWTPITTRSATASTSALPADDVDLFVDSLSGIRDAIRLGEIPIIPPIALDASCFSLCVSANDAVRAISSGLADHERAAGLRYDSEKRLSNDVDLTPVRIMVINREGGIPSHARGGNPHLSINLESEFEYINNSFIWTTSHPTSLANLALVKSCLAHLPITASAVLVSHRSPKSLIANLITNKPAHSPSLHYSLLRDDNLQHNPTIIRHGLPLRVHRSLSTLDLTKLTSLLEVAFGKQLKKEEFYSRLEGNLDFVIIAGEYEGVAIVTNEVAAATPSSTSTLAATPPAPISYLDKFAVLPSLRGSGTVDFLWGALRDESFGLGLLDALNPNVGGLGGQGQGRDLVWRSRRGNMVNPWYWERSSGFFKIPEPPCGKGTTAALTPAGGFSLFWCEAEKRDVEEGGRTDVGMLKEWSRVIGKIPSCWV